MSTAIFPLAIASEEVRLLTAIGLGFMFGFSLERAGFGNARKLAAQFYLYDMTVFKVMFTAILVAMVGLYTLNGLGLVDMSMMWINPTFMWAQLIGGFLLGTGFILSGLCPGTSVVSAASGRIDAVSDIRRDLHRDRRVRVRRGFRPRDGGVVQRWLDGSFGASRANVRSDAPPHAWVS